MRTLTHLTILTSLTMLAVLLFACENTGGGSYSADASKQDAASDASADASKQDAASDASSPKNPGLVVTDTVAELQEEAEELDCDGSAIQTIKMGVAVASVVVTAGKFDAYTSDDGAMGLDGYYVADSEGGDWSGIMIVVDRSSGTNFATGALLDLTGDLEEYYCMTQIGVTGYAKVGDSSAHDPIDIAPGDASVETYEGVLLRVEDVTVESKDEYGNATVTGGLIVGDEFDVYAGLSEGESYDITGILVWSDGEYRLSPRSLQDVISADSGEPVDPTDPTDPTDPPGPTGGSMEISELQQSSDAMSCDPSIVNGQSGIVLEGTLTTGGFEVHENLNTYLLSDGSTDAFSGIAVVIEKSADQGWAAGKSVRVTGDHVEFYCATQLNATSIEILGDGAIPAAIALDASVTDMEPWEGTIVTITDVQVTSVENLDSYGEVSVSLDGGATEAPFMIDDWIMGEGSFPNPSVGDVWSSVTGGVTYGYDNYRIAPLSADDFVSAE